MSRHKQGQKTKRYEKIVNVCEDTDIGFVVPMLYQIKKAVTTFVITA
ncbi:MAG: hypothetical protein KA188_06455 [Leadbetterella sp.]|nr:hypothetical protein [Leadbetterella sp.]